VRFRTCFFNFLNFSKLFWQTAALFGMPGGRKQKKKCKKEDNETKVHIIKNTTKNNSSFCSQTAGDYRQFVH